jgi:translation initiation factor 1
MLQLGSPAGDLLDSTVRISESLGMSDKPNTKLVWSDDPKDKPKVEGKSAVKKAAAPPVVIPNNWTAVFRLEKNGRGGKTVTVIDQLPNHETFLQGLCKELKSKCGSGGTFLTKGSQGMIEIQGDKRDMIQTIFDQKGFRYKGMVKR